MTGDAARALVSAEPALVGARYSAVPASIHRMGTFPVRAHALVDVG